MRIGELAERSRLSPQAIRYYEHIGVLPAPARTPSGYRDYEEAALGRLGFVRAAQAVGLTLGQIREVIAFRDQGQAPCAQVLQLIRQRAAEVRDRIAELEHMQDELDRLAERAQSLRPEDCPEASVCHLIPAGVDASNGRRPGAGPVVRQGGEEALLRQRGARARASGGRGS